MGTPYMSKISKIIRKVMGNNDGEGLFFTERGNAESNAEKRERKQCNPPEDFD